MKESVKNMCSRFVEDFETVKKDCGFLLPGNDISALCAFLFAANGKRPDPQQIKAGAKLIKDAVGNALCFGESMLPPTACILSMSANAENLISDTVADYHLLKNRIGGIASAKYPSLSALIIELMGRSGVQEEKTEMSRELYDTLRSKYSIMTGGIYTVLSMLLAYSGKTAEDIIKETEWIAGELEPVAGDDSRHLTAMLLTYFDKPAAEKTEKFRALYKILAEHKPKYPNRAELLFLAALSMFADSPSAIAAGIAEAFDELGEMKRYKGFLATIDEKTRLLHAALIVMAGYTAESGEQGMYIPALAAAFLPIMNARDRTTAAIAAGHGAL